MSVSAIVCKSGLFHWITVEHECILCFVLSCKLQGPIGTVPGSDSTGFPQRCVSLGFMHQEEDIGSFTRSMRHGMKCLLILFDLIK